MSTGIKRQAGFTIIELLIATTVFSLVLLMAVAGILQISKQYYQGVTQARVQEAARAVTDEIGESIRFSTDSITMLNLVSGGPEIDASSADDTGYFCLGAKRYTFAIDRQLSPSPSTAPDSKEQRHVLWTDQPAGGCTGPVGDLNIDQPSADGRELLSENMRLTHLELVDLGIAGVNAYRLDIGVAFGDDDLLSVDDSGKSKTCEGAFVGGEFCAVSNLSISVTKRLDN